MCGAALLGVSASGCMTSMAVGRLVAGPTKIKVYVDEGPRDVGRTLAWRVKRDGPVSEGMLDTELRGIARLPEPPAGCADWELVGIDGARDDLYAGGLVKRSPGLLQKIYGCMDCVPPDEYNPGGPAECRLGIGWFPAGCAHGALRVRLPSGEERALADVPREISALQPKLWGMLAVSPLVGALWPVYVILGLLTGVKC